MKARILLPLALAGLSGLAFTQGILDTAPKQAKYMEGSSWHFKPYYDSNMLYQEVIDKQAMGVPAGKVILAIAFRHEGYYSSTYSAKKLVSQIEMSNTKASSATMSTNPKLNRGPDHAVVFKKKTISLPAAVVPQYPWKPILIHKLDRPFPYKGGNFLVEFSNYDKTGNKKSTYNCDRFFGTGSGGLYGYVGSGCPAKKNRIYGYSSQLKVGGAFYTRVSSLSPTTGTALAWIGSSLKTFAGIPLPFDLTPLGFKGCKIYCSIDLTQVLPITGSSVKANWPIPNLPFFAGVPVYAQFALVNATGTTLNLGLSNCFTGIIGPATGGIPIPMAYGYYTGPANPDTDPILNGRVWKNRADTLMFWHN